MRATKPGFRPSGNNLVLAVWFLVLLMAEGATVRAATGLKLRLESGGGADALVVSNLAWHVPAGSAVSPMLPVGPATAEWTGFIVVELRGDYEFQAEVTGAFALEIQGTNVLSATGGALTSEWSRPVRLRKGANALRGVLRREGAEAMSVRLFWRGRGLSARPLGGVALQTPVELAEVANAEELREGRGLYLSLRCARCHEVTASGMDPALSPESTSLEGLAAARNPAWMASWLEHPSKQRVGARMPRVLRGAEARAEAEAITTYLLTLANAPQGSAPDPAASPAGHAATGKALFDSLACGVCHGIGDLPVPEGGVSLVQVPRKYAPGALARFLREPTEHDPWSRMPDFGLNAEEAAHLAAWMVGTAGAASATSTARDFSSSSSSSDLVARGRELVATRGCLNCHRAPLENRFRVKPIDGRSSGVLQRGCLAVEETSGAVPRFDLLPAQRAALRAYLGAPAAAGLRRVPWEDARRWVGELRCGACHEALEGVPTLRSAGAKLRPEWTSNLLSGVLTYQSRPWLNRRMPAWKGYAGGLAHGLAALEGVALVSRAEAPVDAEAAEVGRRLVSASGGFACVTCHPIGNAGATAVYEAPGINFRHVSDRLRPEFALRWIRDPQAVDPGTKMPMYFDETGNSPLADVYGGDGAKTVHALWEYLRWGERIVPPAQ